MVRTLPDRRRLSILAASYASLPLLGWFAWETVHVHIGALAVIPMLFIAYYVRSEIALSTALITGIILGLLDQHPVTTDHVLDFPPLADASILACALCAVVMVTNRLRHASLTNEFLQGSLQRARRAAERDALTGIMNRGRFLQAFQEAMDRSTGNDGRIAVLFCDLDRFKSINDTHGHGTGDVVLRLAAARLQNTVRAMDTVARIGGDEFVVLAQGVHDVEEVQHMAAQIERAFEDPFQCGTEHFAIGITVGVGVFPDDGADPDALLRIADARMYQAKNRKRQTQAVD